MAIMRRCTIARFRNALLRCADGCSRRSGLRTGNRTWGAVGIEGLAPHFFDFEPTFYFRDGGHVAGRLEGSYDLLLTQRLVVQPEAELNFYSKADPARGNGSGLVGSGCGHSYSLQHDGGSSRRTWGLRTTQVWRYRDVRAQAGEAVASPTFVFGVRVWR